MKKSLRATAVFSVAILSCVASVLCACANKPDNTLPPERPLPDIEYTVDESVLDSGKDANAQVSDAYYKWCTSDPIHPKKAGYLNWWMPYFEQFLIVKSGQY